MPIMVCRCDDFREIAPGLLVSVSLDRAGLRARDTYGSRMDPSSIGGATITIDSVTRSPKVDEAVFSDVIAPRGPRSRSATTRGTSSASTGRRRPNSLAHAGRRPGALEPKARGRQGSAGAPAGDRRSDRQARAGVSPGSSLGKRKAVDLAVLRGRVVILRLLGRVVRPLPK